MPIPAFNPEGVLPPHGGNPTTIADLSPYPATSIELCRHLAGSLERKAILRGLLAFRTELRSVGFVAGFQWLDGSFLEKIEVTGGRPPNDLDLVTFYLPPNYTFNAQVAVARPDLFDASNVRSQFSLDHYFVDMQAHPEFVVEASRFWAQLFSHRKSDRLWKGMLRLEINTPQDDVAGGALL